MLHCDLRVRWKVASDLRFRAAISESKTPSLCGISGDLAPSTRKSLAIAIVRFWCAKLLDVAVGEEAVDQQPDVLPRSERFRVDEQVLTDGATKMTHHRRDFKMVVDDHARFMIISDNFFHPYSKLMMLMLF